LFEAAVGRYPIPPPTRAYYSRRFHVPVEEIDADIDANDNGEMESSQEPQNLPAFVVLSYIANEVKQFFN
jgi:hypothetical protein